MYSEILPHTEIRPKSFIASSTVSKNSPPTYTKYKKVASIYHAEYISDSFSKRGKYNDIIMGYN